jgi:hypothetical protein
MALAKLSPSADLDVRGTTISTALLNRILGTLADQDGPKIGAAMFKAARFEGRAGFDGAHFAHAAIFELAQFTDGVSFDKARFESSASFVQAVLSGRVSFTQAQFCDRAGFDAASFGSFSVSFLGAKFSGAASFAMASFSRAPQFENAVIGFLDLRQSQFGPENMSLWINCNEIDLSPRQCPEQITIQISGGIHMDASNMHCPPGFTLRLLKGNLTVANAAFPSPAIIARLSPAPYAGASPSLAPRLLGLSRVDAANLTLSGLNLSACRFLDCYNRDQLRIDGQPYFAMQPRGWRWTRRHILAEEHLWRARYDRHPRGWFPPSCRHPGESTPARPLSFKGRAEAARIQTVYRDLRKGREDAKDEPGAADFYYGEMEMRRQAAAPGTAERALLTAYWAVSGYGLRGSRSLAALVVLLLLAAIGFATVGFAGRPPGYLDSLIYAAGSVLSLSLTHGPAVLTRWGEVIRIILRIAGPVCLALGALAIRGRVKR